MPLSAPQMARISQLLDEALGLDMPGRERWLAGLSSEHHDLLPKLRQILLELGAKPAQSSALETIRKFGEGPLEEILTASGLHAGERVGPYELVRPLGVGGMAEVWLARRADGAFRREVALKLPMVSRMRKDLAARFVNERDILAALEHVHIARLYDAGVTTEGLPYLAMEFVAGEPLSEWCDRQKLDSRQRIRLFLQVLDAVEYAHARHVVHRDIKPSNILVTGNGEVRLLDFGVAKLLDQEDGGDQQQLTKLYGRALTPDYSSPEQLLGETVDAQSDIYSLGVMLYELLAGRRPYRLRSGASLTVLERAIVDAEIQRPSAHIDLPAAEARASTPARLARELRGDLDAIVLKALAREPRHRYPSAAAMAEDLQRHLAGVPVLAQPPRIGYRLGKFVLRHRTGLAVGLAGALAVVATGALMRSRAPQTPSISEKSIAVLPFADLSEKKDQEYFSDGLSADLIDHLVHARGLKVIARTSSFSFKGKDQDVRTIGARLGVAHILEGSVRKSGNTLRITAELVRASDGIHLWSQTYDRGLKDIFALQDEIAETVARALKVTINADPGGQANRPPGPEAYNLKKQGDYFAGRYGPGDLDKALSFYRKALQEDPGYAEAWAETASVLLAQTQSSSRPPRELMAAALDAARRSIALNANLPAAHSILGWIYLQGQWDWDRAQAEFERSSELSPAPGEDAFADFGLANIKAWRYGQIDFAIDYYRRAIANDPLNATSYFKLADMLYAAGRPDEALVAIRKVLELSPGFQGVHDAQGLILLSAGKKSEGLAEMEREPDEELRLAGLSCIHWAMEHRTESDAAVRSLESRFAPGAAYDIATAHACRGEQDAAFEWLDRAARQGDANYANMLEIRIDPLLRNLHADPRFGALLRRLHLEGAGSGDPP